MSDLRIWALQHPEPVGLAFGVGFHGRESAGFYGFTAFGVWDFTCRSWGCIFAVAVGAGELVRGLEVAIKRSAGSIVA